MSLKIFNSQSRKKELFVPIRSSHVDMYVCGPTVYNLLHIGNFRGPVFFNLVRNWLESLGYKVNYALNFTDIDDKIIDRAQQEGVSPGEISEKYIKEYKKDFGKLGLRFHEHNPKVTEHIESIVKMIDRLIHEGKAYLVEGDVFYSISSFPEYGQLSGRHVEDLLAGARVEVNDVKRNPLDFALWKSSKTEPELGWISPWGKGRPGWHIECSAMIKELFGDQIDIHGGGMDLIFPHHENEIAQSEGCSGKKFVKYWMHVNMLNFDGQKMSKSLGNFVTMRDFFEQNDPEIYKWMILSVHYRSECAFGSDAIERAVGSLARIYSSMSLAESYLSKEEGELIRHQFKSTNMEMFKDLMVSQYRNNLEKEWLDQIQVTLNKVEEALNDDFNTPEVFAALFDFVRVFNSQVRRGLKASSSIQAKCSSYLSLFTYVGRLMSLFQEVPHEFLISLDNRLLLQKGLVRTEIEKLVQDRWQARLSKNYQEADRLRVQLVDLGISVMDTAEGPFWEVQK